MAVGSDPTGDGPDPEPDTEPDATPDRRGRRRAVAWWAGLLAVFLGLSVAWWYREIGHLGDRALGGGLLDPGLFVWWLRWTPFALGHGWSPLQSAYLQAPGGVSGMWNTSVPALGVLLWPVTATAGPVVAYNVAMIAAPALSAWTAAAWLTRHAGRAAGALGGLVFGFSPFVAAHTQGGHLNFVFLLLVPVVLMLVEDVLWRAERPWWPAGPLLGLTVTVQLFIGSETLLLTALACVVVTVALALRHPRAAAARLPRAAAAVALAVAVAVALCAYPLWQQFSPRWRVDGQIQVVDAFYALPAAFVHASPALRAFSGVDLAPRTYTVETALFVGWPLLALLAVVVVARARRPGVATAAVLAVGSALLQLAPVTVSGARIESPLQQLQHAGVPLVSAVVPTRLALVTWTAVAYLVATGAAAGWRAVAARAHGRGLRLAGRGLVLAAVVVALVPLVPSPPQPRPLPATPAFFTGSGVDVIPAGSTVLVAPMATVGNSVAQLWQARSGFRFRLVGGYAVRAAGPDRSASVYPPQRTLVDVFGLDVRSQRPYPVALTPAVLAAARAELATTGASYFVLGPSHYGHPVEYVRAVALFGRGPDLVTGGVEVWRLAPAGGVS